MASAITPPDYPWPQGPDGVYVRVLVAASVDGAVEHGGRSAGVSSPVDRRLLGRLRTTADAVVVGAGTARAEDYRPVLASESRVAERRARGALDVPPIVVVSATCDLDRSARLFDASPSRVVIVTTEWGARNAAGLREVADIVTVPGEQVAGAALRAVCAERGWARVLCEGGPRLIGTLLAERAVDDICLTLTPLVVGGSAGRIVSGELGDGVDLDLADAQLIDSSLFLRYVPRGRLLKQAGEAQPTMLGAERVDNVVGEDPPNGT
jgi:riboflavin-specific deaminase-like protein